MTSQQKRIHALSNGFIRGFQFKLSRDPSDITIFMTPYYDFRRINGLESYLTGLRKRLFTTATRG